MSAVSGESPQSNLILGTARSIDDFGCEVLGVSNEVMVITAPRAAIPRKFRHFKF